MGFCLRNLILIRLLNLDLERLFLLRRFCLLLFWCIWMIGLNCLWVWWWMWVFYLWLFWWRITLFRISICWCFSWFLRFVIWLFMWNRFGCLMNLFRVRIGRRLLRFRLFVCLWFLFWLFCSLLYLMLGWLYRGFGFLKRFCLERSKKGKSIMKMNLLLMKHNKIFYLKIKLEKYI